MSDVLMNSTLVNRLTYDLNAALSIKNMRNALKHIWVFQERTFVADFTYNGVNFGFDIEELELGTFRVSMIQRGQLGKNFAVTPYMQRKQILDDAANEAQAIAHIIEMLGQAINRIDAYRSTVSHTNTSSESRIPAEQGGPRVGVLTLPMSKNYGGNLQAFALMSVLRDLGCDPMLLNRRYTAEARKDVNLHKLQLPAQVNKINMGLAYDNISFVEQHILPISRPYFTSKSLREGFDSHKLDAVISGSDQVWRPQYARGILADFFHSYLPEDDRKTRRISYAASFGADTWSYTKEQQAMAADLLTRFTAVSVREDTAVGMAAEHLGVRAQHVLDPTMLLDPSKYKLLIADRAADQVVRRMTTYILDKSPEKVDLLKKVSGRLNLHEMGTHERLMPSGQRVVDKSVEGWLASISGADFVFTDSFHGVAFSIIFNRPFIAFGNPLRGMARFTSILRMFGLEDRLVLNANEANIDKILQPIDWERVNRRHDELRVASIGFLRQALGLENIPAPDGDDIPAARDADRSVDVIIPSVSVPKTTIDILGTSASSPTGKLCTGCGVCVSVSQGSLEMAWDQDGFWIPRATGTPIPENIRQVCPFNPLPAPEVKDEDALGQIFNGHAPKYHQRGGRYINTYVGHSVAYRPGSSSGGVATYIFDQLLKRGELQHLFIVSGDEKGGYNYHVFEPGEDISVISKTRYYPVTMENLFRVIAQTEGKVGVSGVACFMKALRLKQHYDPVFRERIGFMVGIICGGLKSKFYTDFLASSAGVSGEWQNAQYRVKNPEGEANDYFFAADDEEGRTKQIRMRRLGDMWGSGLFKNKACDFCTDVTTELADISLGDAWLPEYNKDGMGNSVVVTRSELADRIIREGIEAGDLSMTEVEMEVIIRSQSGGVNHKLNALLIRHWITRHYTSLPVPALRTRHEKAVGAAEMLVQVLRERVRNNSLRFWRETHDLRVFNRRMQASRKRLGAATAARKKHPKDVYDMLCTAVFPDRPRRKGSEIVDDISPLVRWVRIKIHSGVLDIDSIVSLLPDDQRISGTEL